MTRKSSSRSGSKPASNQGGASLRWLFPVAAVSAFVGFIIYLDTVDPDDPTTPEPTASAPEQPQGEAPETQQDEPQFRFYDMLPESEVDTPDVEAYEPGPGMAERDLEYILQVGSFRSHEDAERQRAQVGFQGLQAYIAEADADGNATWYRVMVGPFESRSKMNRAVDRLVAIDIQPLVRERTIEE